MIATDAISVCKFLVYWNCHKCYTCCYALVSRSAHSCVSELACIWAQQSSRCGFSRSCIFLRHYLALKMISNWFDLNEVVLAIRICILGDNMIALLCLNFIRFDRFLITFWGNVYILIDVSDLYFIFAAYCSRPALTMFTFSWFIVLEVLPVHPVCLIPNCKQ